MTDRDSLDFPWGRWLWMGLLAIVALLVIVVVVANLGRSEEPPSPGTGDVEQVEWSIELREYTPTLGVVTLKGDLPLGSPTETWQDDMMLARTVDARAFEWDVGAEVPVPVREIDTAEGCDELNALLVDWAGETASAAGEARRAEASAFAQHAFNTMLAQGCQPDVP